MPATQVRQKDGVFYLAAYPGAPHRPRAVRGRRPAWGASPYVLVLAGAGCVSAGAVVAAPSTPPLERPTSGDREAPPASDKHEAAAACDGPWRLEALGGDEQVVVVCPHDVRRAPLHESSAFARALSPALDPARDRVCACVGQLHAPPFVDLVFTAHPEEGRVSVQATQDDDLDPELGPAFVACVGVVTAKFAPVGSDACADGGTTSFLYPVRLDL